MRWCCDGGYSNVSSSPPSEACNTPGLAAHRRGRLSPPLLTRRSPDLHPQNDSSVEADVDVGRCATRPDLGPQGSSEKRRANQSPIRSATTSWSGCTGLGHLVPRDVATGQSSDVDQGKRGLRKNGSTSTSRRHKRLERNWSRALFQPLREYRGSPTRTPSSSRCDLPAVHYTMGGLWVVLQLTTTIPVLYAIGEANFFRPRRQPSRASALCRDWPWVFRTPVHDRDTCRMLGSDPVPIEDPAFHDV